MAKKEKKISVSELEKAIGDIKPVQTEIEWNGLKILVKDMLTLEEMMTFVETASDLCFGENDEYMPEIRDFAIRYNVLEMYTNLRLPENMEKKYQVAYAEGLTGTVLQHVNYEQYSDIILSVGAKIDERVERNHSAIRKSVEELINSVNGAIGAFNDIFQDVDRESLSAIVSSLSKNGVDEQKIVEAVMNTRQGSDA